MIESENDAVIIEKFVNDIYIDAVTINFVKLRKITFWRNNKWFKEKKRKGKNKWTKKSRK